MLTRKEHSVLFNIFYRAGTNPSYSELMDLSAEEMLKKLEVVRSEKFPALTIEDMLLSQPRCGIHSCREILNWIGVRPRADRTVEDMRRELIAELPGATQDKVRAMWRALKRTKT